MAGLGTYAIVLITAFVATFAAVPLARRLAIRYGAVAMPSDRRVNVWATPTLGGAAMMFGLLIAVAVATQLPELEPIFDPGTEIMGVVAGGFVIFAVGLIDDVREVSAPAKIAGMVLAGSIFTLVGVGIFFFRVPFSGFYVLSPDLSALITVLWVIGMANAINLVDGLDGLAAGIVAIAAGSFYLYARQLAGADLLRADNPSPLISVIVLGLCLGFLPHNVHPARIFMGDAGALLLGTLMAASTISVGGRTADQFSGQTYFFFAPLFIPLFILGVPVVDLAFAVIRRAVGRQGLATADKKHLHHRLMEMGHGQRRSVLILWTWTAMLSTLVLYPTYTGKGDAVVPLGAAAAALLLLTWFLPGRLTSTAARREKAS